VPTPLALLLAVASWAAAHTSPWPATAGAPDPAADRAAPSAAQDEEEIIVTHERDQRDAIATYVEAVTVESGGQIAKFSAPVCPLSLGLPPGHDEVIETRIRQIADHLRIGSGGSGCRPNLIVIVAEEGGDFVHQLRREHPEIFAALELRELRRIMRLAGPVRTWQVIEPRGADGRPMERISFIESPGGPPRPIARGFQLTGVMPSITQRSTRQDLVYAFVVFDLDALEGLTLLQISDYAAMRALARTAAPAASPAGRSILTLFADRESGNFGANELTSWDAAYLRALYRTGNTLTAHQQRSNVARAMRRDMQSSE
jgi:hypothetical protein